MDFYLLPRRRLDQLLSPLVREPHVRLNNRREIAHSNMIQIFRGQADSTAVLVPGNSRKPAVLRHSCDKLISKDILQSENAVGLYFSDRLADVVSRIELRETVRGPMEPPQLVEWRRLCDALVDLDQECTLGAG